MAGRDHQSFHICRPKNWQLIRSPRAQPAPCFQDFRAGQAGREFIHGAEDLFEPAGSDGLFISRVLESAPRDQFLRSCVVARDDVPAFRAQDAPDRLARVPQGKPIRPRTGRVGA